MIAAPTHAGSTSDIAVKFSATKSAACHTNSSTSATLATTRVAMSTLRATFSDSLSRHASVSLREFNSEVGSKGNHSVQNP